MPPFLTYVNPISDLLESYGFFRKQRYYGSGNECHTVSPTQNIILYIIADEHRPIADLIAPRGHNNVYRCPFVNHSTDLDFSAVEACAFVHIIEPKTTTFG